MTGEHFEQLIQALGGKKNDDNWTTFPEGSLLSIHVSHEGASLHVPRVEAIRVTGDLVLARTSKRDTFGFVRTDVYAIAAEGGQAGQPARRAGFG